MHVALTLQSVVHSECSREIVVSLSATSNLQVFAEQRAVVRMSTVLDDFVSALHRRLSTKVSHTLLCHDDIDIMLRVVEVRAERHNGRDYATFCRRCTSED